MGGDTVGVVKLSDGAAQDMPTLFEAWAVK
jgi:hypothetical protein